MSHEAIRGRHARVQAQLETFSKIGLVGNLVAMSTEDSVLAARVTRIGLIDYRVNSTIGEGGRHYGWDAWKYIVYTDGTEKPLLCRTFGNEDEAWTMCERWEMADDRKRSSTSKTKLPKHIPANPETCSRVSNVDIEDSENAKLKVLMRLYPNLFASSLEEWTKKLRSESTATTVCGPPPFTPYIIETYLKSLRSGAGIEKAA